MRRLIYGSLLGYVAITTGAAFWHRWSGRPRNFLAPFATLGDMLPTMVLFLPGTAALYVYLGLRWLLALLVIHRLLRLIYARRFDAPFNFGNGWSAVAAIGLGILVLAVSMHVASAVFTSLALAAGSMFPYIAAALWLSVTFIAVELLSLRAYPRKKP